MASCSVGNSARKVSGDSKNTTINQQNRSNNSKLYRGDGNSVGARADAADYSSCSVANGDCYSKPVRGDKIYNETINQWQR